MRWVLHENPYKPIYGRKDSTCHPKREGSLFLADYGQPQKAKKHHKNAGGITNVWLHQIPLLNQPNQKAQPEQRTNYIGDNKYSSLHWMILLTPDREPRLIRSPSHVVTVTRNL